MIEMLAVCGVILPSKPPGSAKKKHHKFEGICNAFSGVYKTHLFVFSKKKTLRNSVCFPVEKIHFGRGGLEIFRTLSSFPQLSQHTIHGLLSRTLTKTCIVYIQTIYIYFVSSTKDRLHQSQLQYIFLMSSIFLAAFHPSDTGSHPSREDDRHIAQAIAILASQAFG